MTRNDKHAGHPGKPCPPHACAHAAIREICNALFNENEYHSHKRSKEIDMPRLIRKNQLMLEKTATYYVMHISVAACVAWAVTGDLWLALTLSLLEPSVQAVAFFCHEKAWARRLQRRAAMTNDFAAARLQ